MRELPMADDAPKGDVFRKDGCVGVARDVNAVHACNARAAVATHERARLH
jgi:hypothetical protein